jgi:hypothetical protein
VAVEDVEPLPPVVQDLLREADPFRLTIRARAAVEPLVAMALQSLFVGQKTPDEVKRLGFGSRLSLAISLGLLPPHVKELIKPLTDLRDDFVHPSGDPEEPVELSPTRAKEVLRPCRPYLPEQIKQRLKYAPPILYLQLAAAVIYLQFADANRVAVAEREFAEKAVADARARLVLSLEQITELLAQEGE